MNSDNRPEFGGNDTPTDSALSYLEFSNLLAQYKRAVYTTWLSIPLVKHQQEIDQLLLASISKRRTGN